VAFAPLAQHLWMAGRSGFRSLRPLGWAAAGLGAWLCSIFAHNFARFDHPLEFGQNYQLSGVYESKMDHFSSRYVLHNARIYLLAPPKLSTSFPFVAADAVKVGPAGYLAGWNEAVCGALFSFPALAWCLALPLSWRLAQGDPAIPRSLGLCVALFGAAMTLTVFGYFLATPRYMADFMPSLMFVAAVGMLGAERWGAVRRLRSLITVALGVTTIVTVGLGALLSFDYHGQIAKTTAPAVWERLERIFKRDA
jgi:hypothetical protein